MSWHKAGPRLEADPQRRSRSPWAACLCAMAARLSARQLPGDEAYAMETKAERLRAGAASLIQADAHSYLGVIKAQRLAAAGTDTSQGAPARTGPGADTYHRQRAVVGALSAAADVPMQVLEAGADVAGLAARLAAGGNPNLRGPVALPVRRAWYSFFAASQLRSFAASQLRSFAASQLRPGKPALFTGPHDDRSGQLRQAASRHDDLPGEPAGIEAGEQWHHIGDVVRYAQALRSRPDDLLRGIGPGGRGTFASTGCARCRI